MSSNRLMNRPEKLLQNGNDAVNQNIARQNKDNLVPKMLNELVPLEIFTKTLELENYSSDMEKQISTTNANSITVIQKKRGRPKKSLSLKALKDTTMPVRKRGRPKKTFCLDASKQTSTTLPVQKRGRPKKTFCLNASKQTSTTLTVKKRGRPKKNLYSDASKQTGTTLPVRKRGRPKKTFCIDALKQIGTTLPVRKRGRPKKTSGLQGLSASEYTSTTSVVESRRKPQKISKLQLSQDVLSPIRKHPQKITKQELFEKILNYGINSQLTKARRTSMTRVGRPRKYVRRIEKRRLTGTDIANQEDILLATVTLNHDSSSTNQSGQPRLSNANLSSSDQLYEFDHPRFVISKFCRQMYNLGWATGTGGGMTVKQDDIIYMAPSGVQKEMIEPSDVFECDLSGEIICNPSSKLKLTECAPLFMNAYNLRKAGAVIHSHGLYAVLATLLFKGKEFRISHIEMIKGIKKGSTNESLKYNDTLIVPIIENTLFERDLTKRMRIAMKMYPESNAVLVRRHGVYIWGNTWQRAKSQAECYHYLFEAAVKMKQMGVDPCSEPFDEDGITDVGTDESEDADEMD